MRWGRRFGCMVLLSGATLVVGATAAGAEIDGPCEATVAGEDARPLSASDPGDAVEVDADDVITVGATAAAPISAYDVEMEIAGFSWTVASDQADGNSWHRDVEVADYAHFGVGLYRVSAVSNGVECTGAVLVKVGGRSPLTTMAGAGALILALLAAAGAAFSIRRAGGVDTGSGPTAFRPVVRLGGVVSGALLGLAALVLLQQFGVVYPSRAGAAGSALAVAALVVAAGNAARALTVRKQNLRPAPSPSPS